MKSLLLLLVLVAFGGAGLFASTALAEKPPSPPGQGICEHGNSGKGCKDDPQPEHGSECEEHGQQGGVNEDHCLDAATTGTTETTTTVTTGTTSETTTTSSTTTSSTTTESVPVTTQATTPNGTTTDGQPGVPNAIDTTPVAPPPVTPDELEEEVAEQVKDATRFETAQGRNPARVVAAPASDLPYTGLPLGLWAALGALLTGAGLVLRRAN